MTSNLPFLSLLSLISLAISDDSFAFNNLACNSFMEGLRGFNRIGMSSTQFSSSTGECSLITKKEKAKIFHHVNFENLRNDSSRGQGEYLNSFLALYKKDNYQTRLMIKNDFEKFYIVGVDESFRILDSILSKD